MHALNERERERDVREGERTEDERMGWVFCERKREHTTPRKEGGESQVERREKKLNTHATMPV